MFGNDDFGGTQKLLADRVTLLCDFDDGVVGGTVSCCSRSDCLGDAWVERLSLDVDRTHAFAGENRLEAFERLFDAAAQAFAERTRSRVKGAAA